MLSSEPVLLVGLPRSGSTLLNAIVNQCPDTYCLNDLYILQLIDEQGSWDRFANDEQAEAVRLHLRGKIERQSGVGLPERIEWTARMTPEQLERALSVIDGPSIRRGHWAEMIDDVISAAAKACGKSTWGWNTPQDYLHKERVLKEWPKAKFIFNLRDPKSMLRSYKFYPHDTERARYHPAAQSFAWRKAARAYEVMAEEMPEQTLLLRYDDIVRQPSVEIARLNTFAGTSVDEGLELESLGRNTSYGSGEKKPKGSVEPFELWLSDQVLFRERKALGFDATRHPFSFRGVGVTAGNSLKFLSRYGTLIASDPNIRRRVGRMLGGAS
ncbi:sulfotransferase [Parvularcula sp. ZS-1/3]|uniref:Sulfotransferase n=1 Tax=Parvularcula mediterranea TaxID=2732508 RepID=A0A7Y3RPS4_9PROT|nr:sulfotransferase [Parvularcula mediterranea]NNU17580.1 sulfotransferase [Parvularcula mediterranea]